MVSALVSKTIPAPRFRYSPFVKAGPFIQTAGLIGLDPETNRLAVGGPGPETAQILRNIAAASAELSLSFDDLVIARIFTTSMARFAEVNREWEQYFNDGSHVPARTAVGVSALPLGASVEMEFQFYAAS